MSLAPVLAAPPRRPRAPAIGRARRAEPERPIDDPADPPALLARLADELGPGLRTYALHLLAGRADAGGAADEAVQTALVRLAARLARDPADPDGGPPADPAGWLFVTVRNLCRDAARTRARRRRREGIAAKTDWFVPDPAAALDAAAAAEALQALPPELREPVVLHLWGGRSFAQIAALSGRSRATAHRRYAEGLAELRRRLGAKIEEPRPSGSVSRGSPPPGDAP